MKRISDNRVSIKKLSILAVFLSPISMPLQAEETIGQAPEEDISHLFLRNSEVLLKPKTSSYLLALIIIVMKVNIVLEKIVVVICRFLWVLVTV